MPKFGRNHFPRSFGGATRIVESEHAFILSELEKQGYDVSEGSTIYVEAYSEARLSEAIWAINARARNQALPMRMQEMLPVYEAATRTQPEPGQRDVERRRAVAGKLRGIAGNATPDVAEAVAALAGRAYVGVDTPAPADQWAYWIGGTPGPPGFEWASNRAVYTVVLDDSRITQEEYLTLISKCADLLNGMIPAWMSYEIGVYEGGFKADIGRADITLV